MEEFSSGRSELAAQLANARAAAGLTTRAVAERLKAMGGPTVTHASVANYERGVSAPSTEVLAALALVYGVTVESFFRAGSTPTGVRFRKTASLVKVSEEKQYLATAARHVDAYRQLERTLSSPLRNQHPRFAVGPDQTGEELAAEIRRLFDLPALASVPSVIDLMEQFGVRVIELPTASRIDGFAARFGCEHVVVLNPNVPNDRGRLNAGHEWGHVLYEDCGQGVKWSHKAVEGRAYEFAFHLLMPPAVLCDAFSGRSMVKLVQFKERYGVSLAAMVYRAEKVGILGRTETEWLWRQFAMRGWRKREPGTVRPDRAIRFERLFEEAVQGRAASRHDLLWMMGLSEAEMQARLDLAAGMESSPADQGEGPDEPEEEGRPNVLKFPQ